MGIVCDVKQFVMVAALTLLCILLGAQAKEVPLRGPIPFAVYDKNGDELISEYEFQIIRKARMEAFRTAGLPARGVATEMTFSELDHDGDGHLSIDELTWGQRKQMSERSRIVKSRGMGLGGRGKMPAFTDFDLDGNGKILEPEFLKVQGLRMSERVRHGGQLKRLANAAQFSDIDKNGDGLISVEEFAAHQLQWYGD